MKAAKRALFCLLVTAAGLSGCLGTGVTKENVPTELWAVDTNSGQVFEADTTTSPPTGAASAFVSVGQNAAGEIRFGYGKGFVAVGADGKGNASGLYYFNPKSAYPVATRIGSVVSAQYICLLSSTLGYVTVADYSSPAGNGLYSFNPSSPAAGLTQVVGNSYLTYPQDIVLGGDGYLYVAENAGAGGGSYTSGSVVKVDTGTGTAVATYTTSTGGCTGLLAGTYNGSSGVFVASTGGYDTSYNQVAGTIEFIESGLASGSPASMVVSNVPVARIAAFDSTHLIATGGYPAATHLIDLSGASPSITEASLSSVSFGSADVDIVDGVAYIPGGYVSSTIYAVTSAGSTTSFTVGSSPATIGITNVGAYAE